MRGAAWAVVPVTLAALPALWPAPDAPQQPTGAPVQTIVIDGLPPKLALSECAAPEKDAAAAEACRTLARVLRSDLEFEGLFDLLPEGAPAASADFFAQIRVVARAGSLEAEVVVLARSGKSALARSYPTSPKTIRATAHEASDDVVALTQYRGVARSRIAFASDRDATPAQRSKEIYIVDYDGANAQRYTVSGLLNILPAWSPDGRSLAFVSYAPMPAIFVGTPGGTPPAHLTPGAEKSFSPAWSPDGRRIAFVRARSGDTEVWVADADGGSARQITFGASPASAPCWSPNGREIAFTSGRRGAPQIWIVDADGLGSRQLVNAGLYNDAPAWNPARQYQEIAFASRLEGGRLQIAVVDLGSGQGRQITEGTSCESPSWAPNGRHLVFSCETAGTWQITVADRYGGNRRTLPAGPGNNVQPDWGPA